MYLPPGEHWILDGLATGGDYTLTLTPLGPRAAGSEREPNNDSDNAEPLSLGEVRTGRLPGPADVDVYRFSLQAQEHVVVHVDPPADGGVRVRLTAGDTELMRVRDPATGQPLVYDVQLPTGDYELALTSDSGSIAPYRRGGRARRSLGAAAGPGTQRHGRHRPRPAPDPGGRGVRLGCYRRGRRLVSDPAPPDPTTPIVVTTDGAVTHIELSDGTHSVTMDADAAHTTWTSRELPGSVPMYLHVTSGGDYRVTVSGGGLTAGPASRGCAAHDDARPGRPGRRRVRAVRPAGQRALSLTNSGSGPLDLVLDGTTSDDRWTATPSSEHVTVPAGASVAGPRIHRGARRMPGRTSPTRITVRATTADGRQQTAAADVTPRPRCDTRGRGAGMARARRRSSAVSTSPPWHSALRSSLSATRQYEEQLHDGLAVAGAGYTGSISGQPVTFTVDLATDDPVPVRGLIVDPLAGTPVMRASPRAFDLLLSDDGTTWDVALTGELSPRQDDQAFVLDAPGDGPVRAVAHRLHLERRPRQPPDR